MNYIHSVEHVQRNPYDDVRRREGGEGRRLKPEPSARSDDRSECEEKCLKTAEPAPHAVHEATPSPPHIVKSAGRGGNAQGASVAPREERAKAEGGTTDRKRSTNREGGALAPYLTTGQPKH